MRTLLFGHDAEVAHWVCERIPYLAERIPYYDKGLVLGPSTAIGVLDRQGRLIAGVVYHAYDPFVRSLEVSCAAETARWLDRDTLRALLRYCFGQVGCQRISAVTPRRGTRVRRFLEGLAFRHEGTVRRGFGTENALIYGLLAEDWAAHPLAQERGLTVGEEKRSLGATGP